ncbi:MAG: DUF4159 domain-containing protein [Lentisphaeria bacterium]|nr:DUF4159 domain-containing protein [Lentisphaeria bacterium]NQZ69610.1 DUF4159 domain-containing protein [Lentisphaeria bacterium]
MMRKTQFINSLLCFCLVAVGTVLMILAINLHMGSLVASAGFSEVAKTDGFVLSDCFFMLWRFFIENDGIVNAFVNNGTVAMMKAAAFICGFVAIYMIVSSSLAILIRKKITLKLLRLNCILYYLIFFYMWFLLSQSINTISGNQELWAYMNGGDKNADKLAATYWMINFLWPAATLLVFVIVTHIVLWRRKFLNLYNGEHIESAAPGDQIFEEVRTHGADPQWGKSFIGSGGLHVFVLIILPILINLFGCVSKEEIHTSNDPGNPFVELVLRIKPVKKPRDLIIFNPLSNIILFSPPGIEVSKLLKQIDEETKVTYVAQTGQPGEIGDGGEGKGWIGPPNNATFRFVRLQHGGRGWDYGMGSNDGNADRNFLEYFKDVTQLKTHRESQSIPIRHLAKYANGYAPAFVYITGTGNVRISDNEIEILRKYILKGGMIFADAGSKQFDSSIRHVTRRLGFGSLQDIDTNDVIFMQPYSLDNGSFTNVPHGGRYAKGIKHNGRWVVFYFPGDMKDAWKDGASGFIPEVVDMSYKMGLNIAHYAFTNYLKVNRKIHRK